MNRRDVCELHYICHVSNVSSILRLGILSHNAIRLRRIPHESVALADVQGRRACKCVGNGRRLHDHANLYFHARNPMMYFLKDRHAELAVLRLSPEVLDIPESVISDSNAARGDVRFHASPQGLGALDRNLVYARSWVYPGDIARQQWHKGVKCAEVLVPQCVCPNYIVGAHVSCRQAVDRIRAMDADLSVSVSPDLFFRIGGDEPWSRSYRAAC